MASALAFIFEGVDYVPPRPVSLDELLVASVDDLRQLLHGINDTQLGRLCTNIELLRGSFPPSPQTVPATSDQQSGFGGYTNQQPQQQYLQDQLQQQLQQQYHNSMMVRQVPQGSVTILCSSPRPVIRTLSLSHALARSHLCLRGRIGLGYTTIANTIQPPPTFTTTTTSTNATMTTATPNPPLPPYEPLPYAVTLAPMGKGSQHGRKVYVAHKDEWRVYWSTRKKAQANRSAFKQHIVHCRLPLDPPRGIAAVVNVVLEVAKLSGHAHDQPDWYTLPSEMLESVDGGAVVAGTAFRFNVHEIEKYLETQLGFEPNRSKHSRQRLVVFRLRLDVPNLTTPLYWPSAVEHFKFFVRRRHHYHTALVHPLSLGAT